MTMPRKISRPKKQNCSSRAGWIHGTRLPTIVYLEPEQRPKDKRGKYDLRAVEGVYLGPSTNLNTSAHKVWVPTTNNVYITNQMVFNEAVLPLRPLMIEFFFSILEHFCPLFVHIVQMGPVCPDGVSFCPEYHFQPLFFTQPSHAPFGDMYIRKKNPNPPPNTPIPGLNRKVGKLNY